MRNGIYIVYMAEVTNFFLTLTPTRGLKSIPFGHDQTISNRRSTQDHAGRTCERALSIDGHCGRHQLYVNFRCVVIHLFDVFVFARQIRVLWNL